MTLMDTQNISDTVKASTRVDWHTDSLLSPTQLTELAIISLHLSLLDKQPPYGTLLTF